MKPAPPPLPRAAGQSGFSLMEALIGVIILAIATIIMTVSSRTAQTGQERSKIYGEASTATWEVLETIQNLPIDSMDLLHNSAMDHSQDTGITVRASIHGVLPGDVADINDLDTTSLRKLDLNTTFKGVGGEPCTMKFHTIVYQPK